MKNIYILPTDKPSRLYKSIFWDLKDKQKLKLTNVPIYKNSAFIKYNIYITNDEEIKDKCYVLSSNSITPLFLDGVINTASMLAENQWRKVILTDNKDLIADGVQAIDDEFLEWFVKNPSCNMVEISLEETQYSSGIYEYVIYKREIPKEEPKKIFDLPIATNLGNALTETMKSVSQHEGGIKQGEINLPNFKEEVIKTEEDAKIFVETMENIPEPNDKLKKAFRDFSKQETSEYDLLQHIKFCLECKNDSQAIRLIEKYGVEKQEGRYSLDELRLWLIERDIYLHNYYTTYKKSGIPMESVDKYIEDSHEYLMGRKQFKSK